MVVVLYYPCSVHGHLALALTGLGKEKNVYISFYPDIGQSKAYFRLHNLEHDGSNITSIVVLPSEESSGYGLSERAILKWWQEEFVPNKEGYGLFNNNCSSIVYRALCAGQENSESLNHTLVKAKSWFCETPWGIFDYARELGQTLLQGHERDDELYLKFAELKQYCEFGEIAPYHQAMALYVRIKQFSSNEYSLIINKVFCDNIKNTLDVFRNKLQLNLTTTAFDKLMAMAITNDIENINIDMHFKKLRALADFIYLPPNTLTVLEKAACKFAERVFEETLKTVLLASINEYVNAFNHHHLVDQDRIQRTFAMIKEKVIDANNPLAEYFQFGGKIMPRLFATLPPKLTI